MNKYKGDQYELFIANYLKNTREYDSVWFWKDIPEKILFEENIITDYATYSLVRNDIGIDILVKKGDDYTYIQCKNYTNSICIVDLSGYFFFKSAYKKNCKVYFNGSLSNRIRLMHPNNDEFINIIYENNQTMPIEILTKNLYIPRDYQLEAVSMLKEKNRSVVNLPCGMGKTYLSCLLSEDTDNIIFFAPTKELCIQTYGVYRNYFTNHNIVLISGDGTRNPNMISIKEKNIYVSTFKSCDIVNTIINKLKNPFIIIDEFHNLSENDISKATNHLYSILHSQYKILFLSATPKYLNHDEIFGTNIYKYNWNDAIKNKYINDFDIVLPPDGYTAIDFKIFIELFKIDDTYNSDNLVICKYVKKMYFILRSMLYNGNKKCIIYLPTTKKASICESIIGWMKKLFGRVINTSIIDYNTSKIDRKISIDTFIKDIDINIILNVHVLDEGINIPECDSVFITNPSNNIENIVQRMSRCNRLLKGKNKSFVYMWCNENKINTIMDYINDNTNNEIARKFKKIDFGLNKIIENISLEVPINNPINNHEVGFNIDPNCKTILYLGNGKSDNIIEFKKIDIYNDTIIDDLLFNGLNGSPYSYAKIIFHFYEDIYIYDCTKTWFEYVNYKWLRLGKNNNKLKRHSQQKLIDLYSDLHNYYVNIDTEKTKALKNIIKIFGKNTFMDNIMDCICGMYNDKNIGNFENKLDINSHLFGFANGVYDLDTFEFRQGIRSDYISMTTGYDYKNCYSEKFGELERFLKYIIPDDNERNYALTVLSIALTGNVLEAYTILYEKDTNLKMNLVNLLKATFGDYYGFVDSQTISDSKNRKDILNIKFAHLTKKRIVVTSKIDKNDILDGDIINYMSSRHHYIVSHNDQPYFEPNFTILSICNEIPNCTNISGDLENKMMCIQIVPQINDYRYNSIDFDEWKEDFILLLMKCYKTYMQTNIIKPTDNNLLWRNKYFKKKNLYLLFLKEYKHENEYRDIHCSALYNIFNEWLQNNNHHIDTLTNKGFVKELKNYLDIKKIRINNITQLGIKKNNFEKI